MVYTIFVGAYDDHITTLKFDPSAGSLEVTDTSPAGSMPSWLSAHPTHSSLIFASNETDEGKILMFENQNGQLKLLQSAWSGGAGTAHFLVLENEIVTGNYSTGTLLTIPLSLSPPAMFAPTAKPVTFAFPGTGPDADRQEASHPHQVAAHPSGKQLLIPDLGSDKVWVLDRDEETKSWKVCGEIPTSAGHGPRHLVVKDETIYVLNELQSSVSTYAYHSDAKQIKQVTTLPTVTPPRELSPGMLGAEILLAQASASYPEALIYASNRNDSHPEGDSIAIYSPATSPDSTSGFELVAEVHTGINHLRALTFGGPDDKYVMAGGMNGGGIKIFERVASGRALREVAKLEAGVVKKPTSFVMV